MKTICYLSIFLSMALFIGCSKEEFPTLTENVPMQEVSSPIVQDILANVTTTKFGGYTKTTPATRYADDFSISPYVESGDTLMYIVQFSDGWEVYSATKAAPMLLFSCPTGVFDMTDDEMPNPVKDIFNSTADNLRIVIKSKVDTLNPTWNVVRCTPEELKSGKIIIDYELLAKIKESTRNIIETRSGDPDDEQEEGHWVLLKTEVLSESTYTSPKLIQTKWGQESPWNLYAQKKYNSETFSYKNALVGCVAVAVGQYQYYTHYKDGVPFNTVSSVVATSNGLDYTFSGTSSTVWDKMAKNDKDDGTHYSAMLLGSVGRQMSAVYGLSVTNILPKNMEKYLENTYGVDFYSEKPTFDVIRRYIDKSYPLIASGKDPKKGSHCFLIDQYTQSGRTVKYTYGWEGPNAPGMGADDDTNDRDEDGNIVGWGVQNEIVKSTSFYKGISMNWGYYGDYDNIFYYNMNSWTAGNLTFDTNLSLSLRNDLK